MHKEKIDLLNKWKGSAWHFSTGHYDDRILKEKISFIVDRLESAFGANYFRVKDGIERPLEKISWLYSLLAIRNFEAGIEALLEIAVLIDYLRNLDAPIQKEFNDLRSNPIGLRSFFSELFMFRLLDRGGVINKKKIEHEGQVLEGTCVIGAKTFLFECRKLYAPNLQEMDLKWRVFRDFAILSSKLKRCGSLICTINFERPLEGRHRNSFLDKIRVYFDRINKLGDPNDINNENKDAFGVFKAINYTAEALDSICKNREYEILFYLEQTNDIAQNGLPLFKGEIVTNFNFSKNAVYKKLKTILKEKKDQHKDSGFDNKIIFLDSESLSEFYFGLFADPRVYDEDEIIRVYKELHLNSIVCTIIRDYRREKSHIFTFIVGPKEYESEVALLAKIFQNVKTHIGTS